MDAKIQQQQEKLQRQKLVLILVLITVTVGCLIYWMRRLKLGWWSSTGATDGLSGEAAGEHLSPDTTPEEQAQQIRFGKSLALAGWEVFTVPSCHHCIEMKHHMGVGFEYVKHHTVTPQDFKTVTNMMDRLAKFYPPDQMPSPDQLAFPFWFNGNTGGIHVGYIPNHHDFINRLNIVQIGRLQVSQDNWNNEHLFVAAVPRTRD